MRKKNIPVIKGRDNPLSVSSSLEEIFDMYMEWNTLPTIARKYKISVVDLRKWIKDNGWKDKRSSHTSVVLEKIIEKGLKNPKDPDWKDVINAVRQINELQGKFVERKAVLHMGLSKEEREAEYEKVLEKVSPEVLDMIDGDDDG